MKPEALRSNEKTESNVINSSLQHLFSHSCLLLATPNSMVMKKDTMILHAFSRFEAFGICDSFDSYYV